MTSPEAFTKQSPLCLDGRIKDKSFYPAASGGYADVYVGFLDGKKVAIKVVRPFGATGRKLANEKLLRRLWREYLAWSRLSHRNILACLGYSYDFSPGFYVLPSLVSPWMEKGTVTTYLRDDPNADPVKLLAGIADGLAYLHTHDPVIVHGDLRAGNILVSDQGVPCLIDFGLSRVFEDIKGLTTTSEIAGSVRWMSRELLLDIDAKISMYTDIWAYGMTVLEILSGERPYSATRSDLVVLQYIRDGCRPCRPQGIEILTDELWDICERCWSLEPTARPPMTEILSILVPPVKQESSGWTAVSSSRNPDRTVHIHAGHLLEHRDNRISNLRFSADGAYIAVGSWSLVEIYSTRTGAKRLTIETESPASISATCFNPDGTLLAIGDADGRIMIGNIADRSYIHICEGCEVPINALEFAQDGRTLVSLSQRDGMLQVWDIPSYQGRVLRVALPPQLAIRARILAISPCARLIALSLGTYTYIWDIANNVPLERLPSNGCGGGVTHARFTPDGRGLCSLCTDGNTRLWDMMPFLDVPGWDVPLSLVLLGPVDDGTEDDAGGEEEVGRGDKGSVCVARFGATEYPLRGATRDGRWTILASGCAVRFWDADVGAGVTGGEATMAEVVFAEDLSAAVHVESGARSGILATMGEKQDSVTLIYYNIGN